MYVSYVVIYTAVTYSSEKITEKLLFCFAALI